jgi:hypothetical protein
VKKKRTRGSRRVASRAPAAAPAAPAAIPAAAAAAVVAAAVSVVLRRVEVMVAEMTPLHALCGAFVVSWWW